MSTIVRLSKKLKANQRSREIFWSCLTIGLPLLVYLKTVTPTVSGLDSAELTAGAYVLGIIHAPGSPLYLLIGHLFAQLPLGDVGYRLNVMSTVAITLTILLIYRSIWQLTHQRFFSILTAWFIASSYYVWISALTADDYPLHACFAAGLVWLGLQWRENRHPLQLLGFAFLFGLGLTNHLSMILLTPGLAWLVLSVPWHDKSRWRLWLQAGGCVLAGASVYLYLPLRYLSDTPLNYARDYWHVNLATWDGFWWMVTGRMFGTLFFGIPLNSLPQEFFLYGYRLWSNYLGLGLLVGLAGLIAGLRRQRQIHIALLLMFVGHLFFYIPYRASDKELMFLPTYVIVGIWIGLGFSVLAEQIQKRFGETNALLVPTVLVLLTASCLAINFSLVDLSQDWSARQLGESILSTVEPRAYYFGTWADVPILEYLQVVEQQRKDITTVNLIFTGPDFGANLAREKLRAGYPVYTSTQWLAGEDMQIEEVDACKCYQMTLTAQVK